MGVIEIADVETAYGQEIDEDDEQQVQYYIDIVTAYLEDYTGLSFSPVGPTAEVCISDKYGVVDFACPVEVSKVEEYDGYLQSYTEWPTGTYSFNGVDSVYGLSEHATYRITISYGYQVAPDSIQGIATDLVLAGSGLDPAAAQGLVKKRVGDREEQYGVDTEGNVSLTSLQADVLERYAGTAWTWRT